MKHSLLLILILNFCNSLYGQGIETCISSGIEFTTQEQIDGFSTDYPGCNTILGDVKISGANIQSLQGLNQIQTIRGGLEISDNSQLQRLTGLEQLDSIYGTFNITLNPSLQIIDALDSLNYVGISFTINNNASLTTIENVDNINYIGGSLRIIFNSALVSITGYQNVREINGNFSIGANPAIESINRLRINSIQGNCAIAETKLEDLLWLDSLEYIGGGMSISANPELTDFQGLESLKFIQFDGFISNNSGLVNLNGLHLDSIGGALTFLSNASIQNLSGLDSLSVIGGDLIIQENANLQTLQGLSSLAIIRGRIIFSANPLLDDIDAMSQIIPVEVDDITIEDSPMLSECAIESICDFLADGRDAFFANNGIGCNSQEEVSAACLVGVHYSPNPQEISIFPNPTSGHVYFNTVDTDYVLIRIFDTLGHEILKIPGGTDQIDLSNYKAGLYFLVLRSGNEVLVARVSKT